jgi:hypothetical protein
MLTVADWLVVGVPAIASVMGAYVSLKPPKRHWLWFWLFVVVGAASGSATLYQMRANKREAKTDKEELNKRIDGLNADLKNLRGVPGSLSGLQDLLRNPREAHQRSADVFDADVGARLSGKKALYLQFVNLSKTTTGREPKYTAFLWNLDGSPLIDPLPVQGGMGDYIRPTEIHMAQDLLLSPAVKARLKAGDRVFGFISIACSNCGSNRAYWVYLEYGKGGWVSKAKSYPDFRVWASVLPVIAKDFDQWSKNQIPVKDRRDLPEFPQYVTSLPGASAR